MSDGVHCLRQVYKFDGGQQEIVYVYNPCQFCARAHPNINRTVYASFGGLLMSLTGSFRHLTSVVLGDPIYILLRK